MIVSCKHCHEQIDAHTNEEARMFLMRHIHLDEDE